MLKRKPLTQDELDAAENLRQLFTEAKAADKTLTQERLAFQFGWKTQSAVSQYLRGVIPLNSDAALKFADFFRVAPSQIHPMFSRLDRAAIAEPKTKYGTELHLREIPVVGRGKGGEDGFFEEEDFPVGHGNEVILHASADHNAFCVRVEGDSMSPRYRHGEYVLVEPNQPGQAGDDVYVVLRNGRKLIKELAYMRDSEIKLISVNATDHPPRTFPLSEVDSIYRIGGSIRRGSGFVRS
ncbi:MAG TPA: S24 family peptidase [Nevskiaceae bacterium]|nr:S24 family peptidase [Nevskiaceae bacterium]